jgi:hypothetical protein
MSQVVNYLFELLALAGRKPKSPDHEVSACAWPIGGQQILIALITIYFYVHLWL